MAAPRVPNPFGSSEEFEVAIVEHRSLSGLARHLGRSENTLRRWAHELGASTRSERLGRPSSCPFDSSEALEAALEEEGSLVAFCASRGVSDKTARRWMREFGIKSKWQQDARRSLSGELLDRATDDELVGFISLVGMERFSALIDCTPETVRRTLNRRDLRVSEIQQTRSPKVTMLQRRIRDLEKGSAELAELRATIEEAAEMVAVEAPPRLAPAKVRTDRSKVDVILHVSDMQFGMFVDPDEVPGGAYSPEIFEERLERYLEAVDALIENTANSNPLGTLWIAQGGDFVEGEDVFKGQSAWHLAMDAGEQVVRLSRLWSAALLHIANRARQFNVEQVAVVSVVGNHGQHGGRSAGSLPASLNYDYLTYEMTRAIIEQSEDRGGISYYDSEARRAVYFQTCGGTVLLTHGEQDKGGGLIGVPVVTGMRNSLTAMVSTGVRPVLQLSGHFHRPAQISLSSDLVRIWSGPWVGQTNLSIGRGGASSPSQHMMVMHPRHGLVAQHRIRLSDAVESPVEIVQVP